MEALSAVDIALWDIRGKLLGQSVHVLLGGPLRAEIGAGVALMVDASHAYDATAAIRYGRQVEELGIAWFEEPVPPEDLAGYREVRRTLSIPLVGREAEFTRFGFQALLVDRAVEILQPDICAAGRPVRVPEDRGRGERLRRALQSASLGTDVALAAARQLLAAIPHNPPGLFPEELVLEFNRSEHPIRLAVLTEPIEHWASRVAIPTRPGLGIEIDRAALDRFRA